MDIMDSKRRWRRRGGYLRIIRETIEELIHRITVNVMKLSAGTFFSEPTNSLMRQAPQGAVAFHSRIPCVCGHLLLLLPRGEGVTWRY